jgi:3-oxoacyl-ACP reductase-like protein
VVLGVLLITGVVLVLIGHREDRTVTTGQNADFSVCAKLEGDAARSCYQSEVGRELASVGSATGTVGIRLTAPADSKQVVTFTDPTTGEQPLLCALHTRVGVTSDDVPGWLNWSEPVPPAS